MFDLGPVDADRICPVPIEIGGHPYFLVRAESEYRLLSSVCPHQGGTVAPSDNCFECPQHGWRFDLRTGRCLSGPAAQLAGVPVIVRDGRLLADVPMAVPLSRPSRRRQIEWPPDLRIRLVGHASLELQQAGFTLLTDPWVGGPAFLGSWITYPDSELDPATLRPDAVWISHEHSDHFHKATLSHFSRETPIYVPDFPNRRMVRELSQMGFTHVQAGD